MCKDKKEGRNYAYPSCQKRRGNIRLQTRLHDFAWEGRKGAKTGGMGDVYHCKISPPPLIWVILGVFFFICFVVHRVTALPLSD